MDEVRSIQTAPALLIYWFRLRECRPETLSGAAFLGKLYPLEMQLKGKPSMSEIQYVSDESGKPISVIVPIELWRDIESERETAYLLSSEKNKERLLQALRCEEGIPFEEALEKLGIRS